MCKRKLEEFSLMLHQSECCHLKGGRTSPDCVHARIDALWFLTLMVLAGRSCPLSREPLRAALITLPPRDASLCCTTTRVHLWIMPLDDLSQHSTNYC